MDTVDREFSEDLRNLMDFLLRFSCCEYEREREKKIIFFYRFKLKSIFICYHHEYVMLNKIRNFLQRNSYDYFFLDSIDNNNWQ